MLQHVSRKRSCNREPCIALPGPWPEAELAPVRCGGFDTQILPVASLRGCGTAGCLGVFLGKHGGQARSRWDICSFCRLGFRTRHAFPLGKSRAQNFPAGWSGWWCGTPGCHLGKSEWNWVAMADFLLEITIIYIYMLSFNHCLIVCLFFLLPLLDRPSSHILAGGGLRKSQTFPSEGIFGVRWGPGTGNQPIPPTPSSTKRRCEGTAGKPMGETPAKAPGMTRMNRPGGLRWSPRSVHIHPTEGPWNQTRKHEQNWTTNRERWNS